MGIHFDALVQITKKNLQYGERVEYIDDIKKTLEYFINQGALFEIPVNAEDLLPQSGKDKIGYQNYLCDYFDFSEENSSFLLTPFKVTAIEDRVSVVIAKNTKDNKYIFFDCRNIPDPLGEGNKAAALMGGYVEAIKPLRDDDRLMGKVLSTFYTFILNGKKQLSPDFNTKGKLQMQFDLWNSLKSYFQEVIYIMDPENFIIERENSQSRLFNRKIEKNPKKRKRSNNIMRKTIMRPHYVCLSEKDLTDFMNNNSKDPRPAHPVRGHWRKLRSDRFVNKKGKTVFIEQYFTGKGRLISANGWTYNVMLKKGPNKVVKYSESII